MDRPVTSVVGGPLVHLARGEARRTAAARLSGLLVRHQVLCLAVPLDGVGGEQRV